MSDTTTRFGIVEPSADRHDAADVPLYIRNLVTQVEALAAIYGQGTLAARPAAGVQGRFYEASDQVPPRVFYDNGAIWIDVGALIDNSVTTSKILDGAVTSAKIADGTIVDADINAAAAIAKTKLALAGTLTNADLNAAAGIGDDKLASPNNLAHRLVHKTSGVLVAATAQTYLFAQDGSAYPAGSGITAKAFPFFDLKGSLLSVPGKTAKLTHRITYISNGVAPGAGITYTLGLASLSSAGGTAGQIAINVGAAQQPIVTINGIVANQTIVVETADASLPGDGVYALSIGISSGMAAGSVVAVNSEFFVHYV